jgi:hypothetical protein
LLARLRRCEVLLERCGVRVGKEGEGGMGGMGMSGLEGGGLEGREQWGEVARGEMGDGQGRGGTGIMGEGGGWEMGVMGERGAMLEEERSPESVGKEIGKLIIERGHSRFIENDLWSELGDEVRCFSF